MRGTKRRGVQAQAARARAKLSGTARTVVGRKRLARRGTKLYSIIVTLSLLLLARAIAGRHRPAPITKRRV